MPSRSSWTGCVRSIETSSDDPRRVHWPGNVAPPRPPEPDVTPDRPPLSVVVPTRDRPELLEDCLAALDRAVGDGDEVIVVDSDSVRTDVAAIVRRHRATYVRAPKRGSSLARNLGWITAVNDIVGFVDDDVMVAADWPGTVVAPFADDNVGFVTGRVDAPEGGGDIDYPASVFTDPTPRTIDRDDREPQGATANAAVRRVALLELGGFDERIGRGTWIDAANDVDLFDRLLTAGWLGRYEPSARAVHVQWRTESENVGVHFAYGKGMGARIAKLLYRDRERGLRLLPQIVRIGGIKTAVTEVREHRRRSWWPPIAWRLGAVVGLVVGLVRLRRDQPSVLLRK